ncbi:hypothetical protein Bca4012_082774 [Brassica carinata]
MKTVSQRFFLAQMGVRDEKMQEKMQAFLAARCEKISTQIKEMERNIRRDLGLPRESSVIAEEESKATIITHALPPESSGLKPRPNQSGKRRKRGGDRTAAVERPGLKKYPPKVALQQLWTVYPSGTLHTDEEPTDHALTPPTAKFDRSAPVVCVTTRGTVYLPLWRGGRLPMAWEKTNPHRYRSAGSVRSCHPPRVPKFDSKAKVTSTGSGNVAAPDYIMKAALYAPSDLSVEAQHRQNEESVRERTIEPLEDPTHKETIVPDASTGEVSALGIETIVPDASTGEVSGVQEAITPTDVDYSQQEENKHERDLDPLGPGTEENIASPVPEENIQKSGSPIVDVTSDTGAPVDADERYDSCREDQLSEPEEDSKFGAGKRQRKRSRKLTGVYEADPRLKKLFDSAKKVEYKPMEETDSAVFEEFRTVLSENTDSTFQINTGHSVDNRFFLDMAEPQKWLTDEHMHVLMNMLWRRRGKHLHKDGIVIFDQYFTKTILSYWSEFEAANDKLKFEWGPNIPKYVTGKRTWQSMNLELGRDVYTVYAPMNWGGDHWVRLHIDLKDSQVMIYDSFVPHNSDEEVDEYLRPLIQSLPHILEKYAGFCSYQRTPRNNHCTPFQTIGFGG